MSQLLKTGNQWKDLNRSVSFYKLLSVIAACAVVICLFIMMIQSLSNPIVVMKSNTENCFVDATRMSADPTDTDVANFIRKWVSVRYEWTKLGEDQLVRDLTPYTTEGLLVKVRESFKSGAEKEFKDKSVSQYVSKEIKVDLTSDKVVATFDRILRLNDIPLIDPAQISFALVRGSKTRMNPQGIYVNGITEYKAK